MLYPSSGEHNGSATSMKLVVSPQESQTAPKWLLDDLEPQGYEIGGPWPKWIDRPPGPNQYAHTDAIPFATTATPWSY